jgi:hypothetical protein
MIMSARMNGVRVKTIVVVWGRACVVVGAGLSVAQLLSGNDLYPLG